MTANEQVPWLTIPAALAEADILLATDLDASALAHLTAYKTYLNARMSSELSVA